MTELGKTQSTNIHNTRLLIRTLKYVLDILQMEKAFTVEEYKHTERERESKQIMKVLHFLNAKKVVKNLKGNLMTFEVKIAKHLKHRPNCFSPSNNLIFEIMKLYKQILQTKGCSKLKLLQVQLAPQNRHSSKFGDHRSCEVGDIKF